MALATVYRYFTSKEHLYAAALLEWAANFPAREQSKRAGARSDETQLRALMRRAVRAFERYPQMMRVEIVIESSPDPNARALFDQFAARNVGALTERAVVDRPRDRGRHRRDGQQRARDAPAIVGARAHHDRRRRPLGAEDARPDLRGPILTVGSPVGVVVRIRLTGAIPWCRVLRYGHHAAPEGRPRPGGAGGARGERRLRLRGRPPAPRRAASRRSATPRSTAPCGGSSRRARSRRTSNRRSRDRIASTTRSTTGAASSSSR